MCGGQCVQQSFLLGSNENEIKSMSVCTQFAGKRRRRKEFIFAKNKAFKSHTIEIVNSCFVKWMTILCSLTLRRYTRMLKAYVDMFLFTIFILLFVTCEREKKIPLFIRFSFRHCVCMHSIYTHWMIADSEISECEMRCVWLWLLLQFATTDEINRYKNDVRRHYQQQTAFSNTAAAAVQSVQMFFPSHSFSRFLSFISQRAHTQKNGIWTKHIAFNLSRLSVYFKCFDTQNYLVLWQPK